MAGPLHKAPGALRFASIDFDSVRAKRGWFLAMGIASILLGVLAIVLPFAAALATTIVIGWLLVIAGVMEGYHAIQNRGWAGAAWELVSAAVQVVAGLVLVAFPLAGKVVLMVLMATYFIAEGALKLIRSVQHREMRGSGWLVFDGLLALALGIVVLTGGVTTAVTVLGLLVGISLLTGGMSMLLIGLGAAQALHTRP